MHIKVDHMMIESNYPAHIQLLMVPRKEAIIIDPIFYTFLNDSYMCVYVCTIEIHYIYNHVFYCAQYDRFQPNHVKIPT